MTNTSSVKRRWVLYVSGFDPAGPAKYHHIYKEQSALAAPLLKAQIVVSDRTNEAKQKVAQWTLHYTEPTSNAIDTETDYVFARWDDLVRKHWMPLRSMRQVGVFLIAFYSTYSLYWRSGALVRMLRLARPPSLALILPWMMVMAGLVLTLLLSGLGIIAVIDALFFKQYLTLSCTKFKPIATTLIALGLTLLIVCWQLEKNWHSLWLIRSLIFTCDQALGRAPELEARLNQHAQRIREAARSGLYDEILIVGHSSGCIMASLAMSRALPLEGPYNGALSLLTLGQWWPLLTCLPAAKSAHHDLSHLYRQNKVKWVDVSAAADGCCFAFKDPWDTLPNKVQTACTALMRPQLVSARWHALFPEAEYAHLKRDRFRFHFQYLYATPVMGDCDFFAITAGAHTLAQRFSDVAAISTAAITQS